MAGWPRAADSVVRMGEVRIDEMTTERIFPLGRESVWRRIRG
jgi:hypothetical protein